MPGTSGWDAGSWILVTEQSCQPASLEAREKGTELGRKLINWFVSV